ncbi:glutamic acid-rich protein-like [Solanum tuberosum]|uniref:glutamic acid-rich protein-like n=1 Tax=Solanum tuberosum TaxID=4113 RepID=UPI00073A08A6|nr:PREDICTED: glutamic acid-rich protein-like [Solanum tuberosum]
METLKSYTDEVKDTIIDALKANLKGVTDLTSVVENEEDEILGENNSNQPCENSVSSGQENKDDNLCERVASLELSMMEVVAFIRDEKLRRAQKNKKNEAIVDEDLIAVDKYFAEEVNEQDEKREEEKLEENEKEIEEKSKRRKKNKKKRRRSKRTKNKKNKRSRSNCRKKKKKNRRSWKRK